MQTASEINSAINNIKYYNQKIKDLAKKQFDADFEQGKSIGMSSLSGTIRFDALGAISADCAWLDIYCNSIIISLKTAEEQDKILYKPEQKEKEE
ncbi:unnamed protein product [marine sediment metagenome]|uniref:Uncharacterized protein n=1 Tax=marine sediment metagenome TaxID=412755 RepID=X0VQ24_9ZZZZ